MDSHDKFNREIPAPVYQKLLAIGKNLERRGFKESSKKPNLFYRNSGDGVVFADMRGTEDVPIWENPVPLIYFGKEELWRRTRLRESIIKELSTEQIPYRFSFYSGSASFELVESGDVYELDTIHREAFADNLFRLFWGVFDDPPDGYCKTCGGDFQKDLYFCSKKCENEGAIDAFLRSVDMAPSCQICNIKELALPYPEFNEYLSNNSIRYVKRLLTHHISYPVEGSAERTIRVCPKCHSRIHNSEEPALKDLKPPAGHSKKFYVKDVSKKGAVTFCGWCQYEWVARTNHPIRCPKCRGEFIVRRFSDSYSCPHCTYPFSKFDDFMEHTRREKSVILEREEKEQKQWERKMRSRRGEDERVYARKMGLR